MEFIILKDEHTTEIYSENEEFLGFVHAYFGIGRSIIVLARLQRPS